MRPAHGTNCCSRGRGPSRWLQPARPSSARPPRWPKSKRLPRATRVTAPRAGFVEALPYKLGERPTAGRPVAILLADGIPYARVYVPEPLRTTFTAGTRVEAAVDGRAEPLQGTVRYVSAEAAFTPYYALTQKDRSRLGYLAEITLDDPAAQALPAGLPIQVLVPAERP